MSTQIPVPLHFLHCQHAKTVFAGALRGSYSAFTAEKQRFLAAKLLN
jgi:hypothetical protein